ncbi:hypothetical protein GcM1_036001 [Golovinomyces cichoracearum]|uniref:Uncharacterized protein n=1 Tax=Golovinomyces cichoracearum TaxID=62708 RepID=A0A420JCG9_9PEZI|nr:hypothetical protein GcM1_036001 [Golovinomyces cichoracearum]
MASCQALTRKMWRSSLPMHRRLQSRGAANAVTRTDLERARTRLATAQARVRAQARAATRTACRRRAAKMPTLATSTG